MTRGGGCRGDAGAPVLLQSKCGGLAVPPPPAVGSQAAVTDLWGSARMARQGYGVFRVQPGDAASPHRPHSAPSTHPKGQGWGSGGPQSPNLPPSHKVGAAGGEAGGRKGTVPPRCGESAATSKPNTAARSGRILSQRPSPPRPPRTPVIQPGLAPSPRSRREVIAVPVTSRRPHGSAV